jgi:hypothetical protein
VQNLMSNCQKLCNTPSTMMGKPNLVYAWLCWAVICPATSGQITFGCLSGQF